MHGSAETGAFPRGRGAPRERGRALPCLAPVLLVMDLKLAGVLVVSALLLLAFALIAYAIAGFWERWSRRRRERRSGSG